MNERESIECMNAEINDCNRYYQFLMVEKTMPSVLYKPKLSKDGNKWCALYGENLMEGVSGWGDSPSNAIADFNKNWEKKI